MAKKRVPIHGNPRQFVDVDPEATKGATLGRDLYGPDGKLLTADQVINPASGGGGTGGQQRTAWKYILEIPANIQKIAPLTGSGFSARRSDGEWFLRSLEEGEGIAIENGSGDAGNPVIALAQLEDSGTAASLLKVDRDQYGRVSGTEAATTTDLPEGANLYHTDERAQSAVGSIIEGDDAVVVEYDPSVPAIALGLSDEYREKINSSVVPANPPADGDVLEFDAVTGGWVAKRDPRKLLIDGGNF